MTPPPKQLTIFVDETGTWEEREVTITVIDSESKIRQRSAADSIDGSRGTDYDFQRGGRQQKARSVTARSAAFIRVR
jgi:hypothetical protein